jgi:hypothetical protein
VVEQLEPAGPFSIERQTRASNPQFTNRPPALQF